MRDGLGISDIIDFAAWGLSLDGQAYVLIATYRTSQRYTYILY